jgi:hypothetical protein
MWGRESATVRSAIQSVQKTINLLAPFGIQPSYPPLGSHATEDKLGYGVVVAMVLILLKPGRYVDHQQFETIRKLRAGFHNVYMASVVGSTSLRAVGGDRAKSFLNHCDTHSSWLEHFAAGCHRRMGQEVHQDRAISLQVMHALLQHLEGEWTATNAPAVRLHLASMGAYFVIAFCGSFRGPEVFLTDLYGLRKYLATPQSVNEIPHVIAPLLGRLRNENGEKYHLTPLCSVTSSGLQVETWIRRLVLGQEHFGRCHGPAFTTLIGTPAYTPTLEMGILDRLQAVQARHPDLISPDVHVHEEYGLSRSFRRGSTSEARAHNVDDRDVRLINQWRSFDEGRGRRPRLNMQDHYSDILLLIPALLRYSLAL